MKRDIFDPMRAILNLPMVTNPDHEGGSLDALIAEIAVPFIHRFALSSATAMHSDNPPNAAFGPASG